MGLSDMLPPIDGIEGLHEIICSECGSPCDHMDDGWTRCNTCVIVFDTAGVPMEDDTEELRADFDLLPGSDPYLVYRMNFDTMKRETKRLNNCAHCRCSQDFLDGHYMSCIWANAQKLAKRSRRVVDAPQA